MYCGLASWFAGRKTLSSRNLLAAYLVARPGLGVQKWSHRRWIKGDTKPLQLSLQEYPGSFWSFCFLTSWSYLRFWRQTFELPWFWRYSSWSEEGVSTDQWNKHPSIPALVLLTCEQFLQLPKFATACQKLVTTVWILTSPSSFAGLLAAQTLGTEFAGLRAVLPPLQRHRLFFLGTLWNHWNLIWPATVPCAETTQHVHLTLMNHVLWCGITSGTTFV